MKKIKTNMHYSMMYILLFSFLFFGCASSEIPPSPETEPLIEITLKKGMDTYGRITDQDKNPIKDIVVTDGFTCVKTDGDGVYQMKKNAEAKFIYYTTPAEYAVNTVSSTIKMANFYQFIQTDKYRYDFTLTKLPSVETNFALLCIGDPQVTNDSEIERFNTETMPDIKNFVEGHEYPVYGISMGDMVGDKPELQPRIRKAISSTSMPVFTIIGNHDKVATSDTSQPRNSDVFCENYGPLNYSFDRGNVHFICLDNIVFSNSETYTGGFTQQQVDWLRQDLSYVPTSKMIILYYHIPIRNSSAAYRKEILSLLGAFAEVHLMCGHTHYTENFQITTPISVYEHIHGAASGSWWRSVINGDGTPNGYAVYEISNNTIKNWYYKSVNYDKSHQIRLHRGNAGFGGKKGYFTYGKTGNTLIANIWNADEKWQINVYENGVKTGKMTKIQPNQPDAWSLGCHIGVLGRNPNNYSPSAKHLYSYKIENASAAIEVEAVDRFGNIYKENQITTNLKTASSYQ